MGVVTGFLSLRVACCRGCCHFSVLGVLGVAKGVFGWFRCVIWFWVMGLALFCGVCGVWGCTGWLGSSLDFGFL